MKRHISSILLLVATLGTSAQTNPKALWPIKDAKPGENIIGKPGQYINGEKNYDNLFIESPKGTLVVAPVDGIVIDNNYTYKKSLVNSFHFDAVKSFNASDDLNRRIDAANELKGRKMGLKGDISRYVSVSIGIQTGKNENYCISGLTPTRLFKTGDRIRKGDVIGKVSYAFSAFDKPHIMVSRSINSKSEDPMGIFGIPTSFKKTKTKTFDPVTFKHPIDTIRKDFNIFRKSLEEIHPGIYDYIAKEQMDSLLDRIMLKLNKPISSLEFGFVLAQVIAQVSDCHTELLLLNRPRIKSFPPIVLGYDGADIVVLNTSDKYRYKKGDKITEINNIDTKTIIYELRKISTANEGYNLLPTDRSLMVNLTNKIYFSMGIYWNSFVVKMKDGRTVNLPYSTVNNFPRYHANNWAPDSISFSTKIANSNIAYLDINTFELNQVEEDSLEYFIGRIQKQGVRNLVIDVRDNGGGFMTVGNRILSYLIDTSKNVLSYRMVKNNATYPMLKYSDSWNADQVIFPEFKAVTGKTGFYDYGNGDSTFVKEIKPNLKTHFNGNIYVLANEYSASMASEFPSVLLGQKNCKIIGRETGSCYYQINAAKFADILMPATGLSLRIPMVKIVMRDTPNPRIPYGHGVIPDYNVPLTLDEFIEPKDVILDRALEIIEAEKTR